SLHRRANDRRHRPVRLPQPIQGKTFSMVREPRILCYGGLRGAIAFGLPSSISPSVEAKDMFLTATIAVIFFTVFLQTWLARLPWSCSSKNHRDRYGIDDPSSRQLVQR
ncbi:hypothetical protein PENTCL1PPCAC_3713, partial [Pristionchus entomophagus]